MARSPFLNPVFRQRGAVLIAILALLGVGALYLFVKQLNSSQLRTARVQNTADALAQAKEALVGDAISQPTVASAGYLRLPDLGFGVGFVAAEGGSPPNFAGNNKDYSVIGKIPWKTLGTTSLRDGQGECLWYVVSGRFKKSPATDALNWDTLGQIDVIDGSGNPIASNLAALIVAPGQVLDSQSHVLSDAVYTECGGNYDARNYLDPFDNAYAVSGEVNYFTGSTNNRVALGSNNKRFVMADNDHYNDRFLAVTVDDIFRPLIRRGDFTVQISSLLYDPDFTAHLQALAIAGSKGTNNIDCNAIANADNKAFCSNWKEMLLLTQLATPSSITIDGAPSPICSRVLIFAGQRIAPEVRATAADKSNKANYLEGANLAAFNVPIANSAAFSGPSAFNANTPGVDILRCLP